MVIALMVVLLSDMSVRCITHFIQDVCVSFLFPLFSTMVLTLLSWILTFPGLWEISFSSQIIIVKPSVFGLRQNLEVIILSFLPAGCLSFKGVE